MEDEVFKVGDTVAFWTGTKWWPATLTRIWDDGRADVCAHTSGGSSGWTYVDKTEDPAAVGSDQAWCALEDVPDDAHRGWA